MRAKTRTHLWKLALLIGLAGVASGCVATVPASQNYGGVQGSDQRHDATGHNHHSPRWLRPRSHTPLGGGHQGDTCAAHAHHAYASPIAAQGGAVSAIRVVTVSLFLIGGALGCVRESTHIRWAQRHEIPYAVITHPRAQWVERLQRHALPPTTLCYLEPPMWIHVRADLNPLECLDHELGHVWALRTGRPGWEHWGH